MIEIYGIKNCTTVKKALAYLESKNKKYNFHDFKKQPPTPAQVKNWIRKIGIEDLINRRGTSWRNLSAAKKNNLTETSAIDLICENPSLIKRPLIEDESRYFVGFSETDFD